MPNRSQASAVALLVAVFLAGGAAGYWLRDSTGVRPEPRLRETRAMVNYLTHELGLTVAEQESVRAVLQRHRAEVEAAWRDVHPRFDSLRATMQREISAQLTPDQAQRYRDLIARLERQRARPDTTKDRD
jgi:Heavy-metal resistance